MSGPAERRPHLVRSLGLFTTTMVVIGGVIGSGIFRKPGTMAGLLGSPELLIGVWIVAGVISLFGALTNAELAAMIPETGGNYVYYDRMYGPFVAYLYGWSVFSVIQTGSIAAVAYVFAEYATWFIHLPGLPRTVADLTVSLPLIGAIRPLDDFGIKMLAAGLIALLTAVNYVGVRFGGVVQNVFTIGKTAGMMLLIIAAFTVPNVGNWHNLVTDRDSGLPSGIALVAVVVAALQGAFWAYDGWNKVTYIAGEVREPQRILPRALFVGMLAVTALYVTMNVVYAYVLPIEQMAASRLVAADAAEKCFAGGGRWIAATVMLSTFGAANAIILASARVYFSMAERGVFPKMLGRVHPRFETPAASLVVQALWSTVLLFSGTFDMLTDTLIFVSWIFYALSAHGVFVLRRKEPNTPRPYRVPGYPVVPWLFIVCAGVFLIFTVVNDLNSYQAAKAAAKPAVVNFLLGGFLVMIGAPLYFYYRPRRY